MPETVRTDRAWGTIEPDTRYDIGHIDVRFEIPFGVTYETMEALGAPVIAKAIEQFERLGDGKGHKWQHVDRIPIQYNISSVPTRDQLDRFNRFNDPKRVFDSVEFKAVAANALHGAMVGMVARVFFVRPLITVNLDELREEREQRGYADGFMTADDIRALKEKLDDHQPLDAPPQRPSSGSAAANE